MDTLYMFIGALCLAGGICLFTGEDFFTLTGFTKKEDYNLDKVFQVEKWISPMDAACSLGMGMNRFPGVAKNILLIVFGATLAVHVYVFKSEKSWKENE